MASLVTFKRGRSVRSFRDGAVVALEGFTHLIPFAAGHEVDSSGPTRPDGDPDDAGIVYDQLIGMGCVAQLEILVGRQPRRRLATSAPRCGRARAGQRSLRSRGALRTPAWPSRTPQAPPIFPSACFGDTSGRPPPHATPASPPSSAPSRAGTRRGSRHPPGRHHHPCATRRPPRQRSVVGSGGCAEGSRPGGEACHRHGGRGRRQA